MQVSVILPTFNEAENIGQLVDEIFAALANEDAEILVVDDDSPDGTWRIVQDLVEQKGGRLRLIRRRTDRGLRASLAVGIAEARGQVLCWLDSDFSMPPSLLPTLVAQVRQGADMAVGSRYVPGGSDGRDDVPLHRWLSLLLTRVAALVLVPTFLDYTSGFIAIRREALARVLPLVGDYGEYFLALIYRAFRAGLVVVEIPYRCEPRRAGISKTAVTPAGYLVRGLGYVRLLARLRLGWS